MAKVYQANGKKKRAGGGNPEIREGRIQAPKHSYKEKHFLKLKATIHDEARTNKNIST